MEFEQALQAMRSGADVKLRAWPNNYAVSIRRGEMCQPHTILATNALDFSVLMSDDWEIVDPGRGVE